MAFTINNNLQLGCVLFVISLCLLYAQGQIIDFQTLRNLSEINQNFLRRTSVPEVARILSYPPYSYHSVNSAPVFSNLHEADDENESFTSERILDRSDGKCSDDLIQIFSNLDSSWAIEMLDSDGKPSSGVLRGGLIWPGHYSECMNVYSPLDEKGHGDFHGQYCVSSWTVHLGGKYSNQSLTVGICVPSSCSGENIKTALKNVSLILERVPALRGLESYLTLNSIDCKNKEKSLDAPAIIYICIVSIFIILAVIGSLIAVLDSWKINCDTRTTLLNTSQTQGYGALNIQRDIENQSGETSAKGTLNERVCFTSSNEVPHTQQSVSAVRKFLLCFSVFSNGQKILNTEQAEGQLSSIHGIRFLSLTWVILGHTYINSVAIIGNKLDVLKDMDTFPFQMLLQSPFSVDSFFLLSGFLLTYLFLKEISKKDGKINWVQFYVHRIWRLTPSYLIVVFFYMLIFKYLGSGPFWDDNHCDDLRNTWWKYVLYINNFIPIKQMCVGWSWYLANDMQFYVISPLILYPLWKWPAIGFSIIGAFLSITWVITGVMSYSYDLIPMFVGATQAADFTAYADRMWYSFDLIYDKPYCRIAPYIVGILLGYVLHKTADRRNFMTLWQQVLGWTVASFCSISVVFGLYHVEMSKTVALFYNSLCRTSFVIGLAWLIFVCETGHGGFLTKFLSWKLFVPLSRLTYSAYLVHPILVHGYYQSYQTALYFTELIVVTNFLGFLIMSFGLAFIFSLVFESPFMNLEKLFLKRKSHN